MNIELFEKIITLSENRIHFLRENDTNDWYKGSISHFDGLFHELEEVRVEMDAWKQVYLEDELGDVFWDFVCLLEWLEQEWKVDKKEFLNDVIRNFRNELVLMVYELLIGMM